MSEIPDVVLGNNHLRLSWNLRQRREFAKARMLREHSSRFQSESSQSKQHFSGKAGLEHWSQECRQPSSAAAGRLC